jgi:hypothetical protein
MTENDIAHLYDAPTLQHFIDMNTKERDFWHTMMIEFAAGSNYPYYNLQYYRYSDRVNELLALQKEKFSD